MSQINRCCRIYRALALLAGFNSVFHSHAAVTAAEGGWKSVDVPNDRPENSRPGSATSDDGRIYRWDFEMKKPTPFGYSLDVTYRFDSVKFRVPVALISPNLAYLAIGTETGAVHIVDLMKKDRNNSFSIKKIKKGSSDSVTGVQDLAFRRSGDKLTLAVADGSDALTVWDADVGRKLASLALGRAGDKVSLAPSPNENLLIGIGSELRITDFALTKWAVQEKQPAPLTAMSVSASSRVLAVAAADHSITVLDGETLKPLQAWKESGNAPDAAFQVSLAVSASGDRIFTTTKESKGTVTVWDPKTGKKTGSFVHRIPNGMPENLMLLLSATAEGKVKTQWSGRDGNGYPALLWSPPEGVELLPPADVWLVHARAVKIIASDNVYQTSEWEILHSYTGGPDLKGKRFRLKAMIVLGTTFDRWIGNAIRVGEEDIWWIKRRKAEEDLVGELGLEKLSSYDPCSSFPSRNSGNYGQMQASAALAQVIEKLDKCGSDAERMRVLVKHAADDFDEVAAWSIWWLRKRKDIDATNALRALVKLEKLSIRGQVMLDEAMSERAGATWNNSTERLAMLEQWVGTNTRSQFDCLAVGRRLGSAVESEQLDHISFGILVRRGLDSTKMIDAFLQRQILVAIQHIRPKTEAEKREMFDLLVELAVRKDITHIRGYAINGLKRCGPFDSSQSERLAMAGLSKAELK